MARGLGPRMNASPSRLATAAATFRSRHEKLLLLRLAEMGERLHHEYSSLSARTGFSESWDLASGLTAEGLSLAVQGPALAGWVDTAERLLANGIFDRYPDSHPARHLKDFAYFLINWAGSFVGSIGGCLYPLARRDIYIQHGHARIRMDPVHSEAVRWKCTDARLSVGGHGAASLEIDITDPVHEESRYEGYAVAPVPYVLGVPVYTDPYAYSRLGCPPESPADFLRRVTDAMNCLGPAQLAFLRGTARAITVKPPPTVLSGAGKTDLQEGDEQLHPWIAGLLRVSPTRISPTALLELAARDYVQRLLCLFPPEGASSAASFSGDLQSILVTAGAQRLVHRLGGGGGDATLDLNDDRLSQQWSAAVGRLKESARSAAFLDALAERSDGVAPRNDSSGRSTGTLTPPEPWRVLGVPVEAVLVKTRRAAAFSIDDFSPVRAMLRLPRAAMKDELRRQKDQDDCTEESAFYLAVAAYCVGDFLVCVKFLARCISFDPDVEEYWHLLGFALRHQKCKAAFDAIMFHGIRDLPHVAKLVEQPAGFEEII
jgi:hypothetical protein